MTEEISQFPYETCDELNAILRAPGTSGSPSPLEEWYKDKQDAEKSGTPTSIPHPCDNSEYTNRYGLTAREACPVACNVCGNDNWYIGGKNFEVNEQVEVYFNNGIWYKGLTIKGIHKGGMEFTVSLSTTPESGSEPNPILEWRNVSAENIRKIKDTSTSTSTCPENEELRKDAHKIKCDADGCTAEKCCENVEPLITCGNIEWWWSEGVFQGTEASPVPPSGNGKMVCPDGKLLINNYKEKIINIGDDPINICCPILDEGRTCGNIKGTSAGSDDSSDTQKFSCPGDKLLADCPDCIKCNGKCTVDECCRDEQIMYIGKAGQSCNEVCENEAWKVDHNSTNIQGGEWVPLNKKCISGEWNINTPQAMDYALMNAGLGGSKDITENEGNRTLNQWMEIIKEKTGGELVTEDDGGQRLLWGSEKYRHILGDAWYMDRMVIIRAAKIYGMMLDYNIIINGHDINRAVTELLDTKVIIPGNRFRYDGQTIISGDENILWGRDWGIGIKPEAGEYLDILRQVINNWNIDNLLPPTYEGRELDHGGQELVAVEELLSEALDRVEITHNPYGGEIVSPNIHGIYQSKINKMDLDNQLKTEHGIHHGIHFPILSPSWRDSEPDVICNPYMDGTFDTEFRRMNNNSGEISGGGTCEYHGECGGSLTAGTDVKGCIGYDEEIPDYYTESKNITHPNNLTWKQKIRDFHSGYPDGRIKDLYIKQGRQEDGTGYSIGGDETNEFPSELLSSSDDGGWALQVEPSKRISTCINDYKEATTLSGVWRVYDGNEYTDLYGNIQTEIEPSWNNVGAEWKIEGCNLNEEGYLNCNCPTNENGVAYGGICEKSDLEKMRREDLWKRAEGFRHKYGDQWGNENVIEGKRLPILKLNGDRDTKITKYFSDKLKMENPYEFSEDYNKWKNMLNIEKISDITTNTVAGGDITLGDICDDPVNDQTACPSPYICCFGDVTILSPEAIGNNNSNVINFIYEYMEKPLREEIYSLNGPLGTKYYKDNMVPDSTWIEHGQELSCHCLEEGCRPSGAYAPELWEKIEKISQQSPEIDLNDIVKEQTKVWFTERTAYPEETEASHKIFRRIKGQKPREGAYCQDPRNRTSLVGNYDTPEGLCGTECLSHIEKVFPKVKEEPDFCTNNIKGQIDINTGNSWGHRVWFDNEIISRIDDDQWYEDSVGCETDFKMRNKLDVWNNSSDLTDEEIDTAATEWERQFRYDYGFENWTDRVKRLGDGKGSNVIPEWSAAATCSGGELEGNSIKTSNMGSGSWTHWQEPETCKQLSEYDSIDCDPLDDSFNVIPDNYIYEGYIKLTTDKGGSGYQTVQMLESTINLIIHPDGIDNKIYNLADESEGEVDFWTRILIDNKNHEGEGLDDGAEPDPGSERYSVWDIPEWEKRGINGKSKTDLAFWEHIWGPFMKQDGLSKWEILVFDNKLNKVTRGNIKNCNGCPLLDNKLKTETNDCYKPSDDNHPGPPPGTKRVSSDKNAEECWGENGYCYVPELPKHSISRNPSSDLEGSTRHHARPDGVPPYMKITTPTWLLDESSHALATPPSDCVYYTQRTSSAADAHSAHCSDYFKEGDIIPIPSNFKNEDACKTTKWRAMDEIEDHDLPGKWTRTDGTERNKWSPGRPQATTGGGQEELSLIELSIEWDEINMIVPDEDLYNREWESDGATSVKLAEKKLWRRKKEYAEGCCPAADDSNETHVFNDRANSAFKGNWFKVVLVPSKGYRDSLCPIKNDTIVKWDKPLCGCQEWTGHSMDSSDIFIMNTEKRNSKKMKGWHQLDYGLPEKIEEKISRNEPTATNPTPDSFYFNPEYEPLVGTDKLTKGKYVIQKDGDSIKTCPEASTGAPTTAQCGGEDRLIPYFKREREGNESHDVYIFYDREEGRWIISSQECISGTGIEEDVLTACSISSTSPCPPNWPEYGRTTPTNPFLESESCRPSIYNYKGNWENFSNAEEARERGLKYPGHYTELLETSIQPLITEISEGIELSTIFPDGTWYPQHEDYIPDWVWDLCDVTKDEAKNIWRDNRELYNHSRNRQLINEDGDPSWEETNRMCDYIQERPCPSWYPTYDSLVNTCIDAMSGAAGFMDSSSIESECSRLAEDVSKEWDYWGRFYPDISMDHTKLYEKLTRDGEMIFNSKDNPNWFELEEVLPEQYCDPQTNLRMGLIGMNNRIPREMRNIDDHLRQITATPTPEPLPYKKYTEDLANAVESEKNYGYVSITSSNIDPNAYKEKHGIYNYPNQNLPKRWGTEEINYPEPQQKIYDKYWDYGAINDWGVGMSEALPGAKSRPIRKPAISYIDTDFNLPWNASMRETDSVPKGLPKFYQNNRANFGEYISKTTPILPPEWTEEDMATAEGQAFFTRLNDIHRYVSPPASG